MEKIPVYKPDLIGNELEYVSECITSGWVSSLGKYVIRFEEEFARFCDVKNAIAVSNGTVALHLALLLKEIGPGDEVIIPDLTFVATANAVKYVGATPVLVDVDLETWTIDPGEIKKHITASTRAIIPVHLYGHPANMETINAIAEQHDLFVIEDAAEAHGAEYKGKKVGGLGHIGAFSFYGNKVITTGEGGMLTTDDDELAERARFLKDHAMSKTERYWHSEVGYNYRMTNIQAALGAAQLEQIEAFLARKIEIAHRYSQGLQDIPGIVLHPRASWARNIYWMYSILVTDEAALASDAVMQRLAEHGVDTRPFFVPLHQLPPFLDEQNKYPNTDQLAQSGINLPSYPSLTDQQVDYICQTLRDLLS